MADTFDVIVLGGGTGGYVTAIHAAQHGLKVGLVEEDKLGGTCLHRGCIPTKVLLRTAEVLWETRKGDEFGILGLEPKLDVGKLMGRKERVVGQLFRGVQYLMKKHAIEVVAGHGVLQGPRRVKVGDRTLEAKHIVIATGSVPKSLPGIETNGTTVINSDQALELKSVPESVIVVGAGAVGVEFASLLHEYGAKVTVVEYLPRLVPLEDDDIGAELGKLFKKRGIDVMTSTQVLTDTLKVTKKGVSVTVRSGDKETSLSAACLLVAVGRSAITENIGLETTKAKVEKGFIQVDAHQQTAEPGLYAIGDCVGGLLLAHKAAAEGGVAIAHIAGETVDPVTYDRVPRATYCHPEVASIGYSEKEAKEMGKNVKIGRFPFRANGKSLIFGDAEGFVKVVSDKDNDDLLGVHMIGPHVTELIAEGSLARVVDATAMDVGISIHPHPTISEALGQAMLAVDGLETDA